MTATHFGFTPRARALIQSCGRLALFVIVFQIVAVDHWQGGITEIEGVENSQAHVLHTQHRRLRLRRFRRLVRPAAGRFAFARRAQHPHQELARRCFLTYRSASGRAGLPAPSRLIPPAQSLTRRPVTGLLSGDWASASFLTEVELIRRVILLSGLAIAGLIVVLSAQSVFAHSRPIRVDPPAGAVLAAAPSQVTGWFTQPLRRDPNWNFLRVTDSQGNRVDSGETVLSADRKQMTVSLNPNLPPGRYQVTWRTWDDNDGRIFGDCYAFFVGQAAADAAVAANTRLDGGNTCQRIDISGTSGTPVAGGTPQATAVADDHADAPMASSETHPDGDAGGVPVWALVLGVVAGVGLGGVGGRLISGRA